MYGEGGNESYSYDANGNRTNTGYGTGTNNQLSSDGTYNYTYDNEGNLTQKTTISGGAYVTYTWDYHNRLTDVKAYNSSNVLQSHVNYVYDVYNRLIEKQVDPTGGGTYTSTQTLAYSKENVVLVHNGSGTLTDRFVNGLDINNALADENGSGTVSWFLKDREGTTNDVVQYNSGTGVTSIVNHVTYNSFGKITAQTNSANQPRFAYTGQMWDADAGLYYYHARWYDPAVGRFISRDPLSFAAGDANLYRYVKNGPTTFTDPNGKEADELLSDDNTGGINDSNADDPTTDDNDDRPKPPVVISKGGKPVNADSPDSMDWTKATLPQSPNEIRPSVAQTAFLIVPKPVPVGDKYMVEYTIIAKSVILIDVKAAGRIGMTLPQAYGHEQLHVKYFMTLMAKLQEDLLKLEKKTYITLDAATKAGKAETKRLSEDIQKKLAIDAADKRKAKDAPKPGKGNDPIGTMPGSPVTLPKKDKDFLLGDQSKIELDAANQVESDR